MRTYATILCLLLLTGPSLAAEPTLARLSFWVPPERMDEFAMAYQEKLLPILKGHGLVESAQPSRATVDSVFSRLFEFDSPSEVILMWDTLNRDSAWVATLEDLDLATSRRQGGRFLFGHYTTPAGGGKVVKASGRTVTAGRGRGHVRTLRYVRWACRSGGADRLAGSEWERMVRDVKRLISLRWAGLHDLDEGRCVGGQPGLLAT